MLDYIAGIYQEQSRYEEAQGLYETIVRDYPGTDHAFEGQKKLAICCIADGNDIAAQAATDKLIADFNDHPGLPRAISKIEEEYYIRILDAGTWVKENYLEPVKLWEKVMTIFPDFFHPDSDLYYFIACCYYQLGQYENAIEHYTILLDNWPDYNNLGVPQHLIKLCREKLANAAK